MSVAKEKNKKWISGLHESIGILDTGRQKALMVLSGKQCAEDLLGIFEKQTDQKISNLSDLVLAWNSLRKKRYLDGHWTLGGDLIYGVFEGCSCPLIHSGQVQLHPVQCHCAQTMLEEIFSSVAQKRLNVEIVRSVGRGDDVCEFRIDGAASR